MRLPHPISEYSLFRASYNSYAAHSHHVLGEAQITRDFEASTSSIFAESTTTPKEEASTSIRSYDYTLSSDSIIRIKSETDRGRSCQSIQAIDNRICRETKLNRWATADYWCQTIIKCNSAWKGHEKEVTPRKFASAMNKVTAFGGYSAMRDYKGNIHGVYANKKEITKNDSRNKVFSYLTTGVPNQKCPSEPTHDNFTTVDITNIRTSSRVEANLTSNTNTTGPSQGTETSLSRSDPNDEHHSASTPKPSASTPNPNPSASLTTADRTNLPRHDQLCLAETPSPTTNTNDPSMTLCFDTPAPTPSYSESLRQHSYFHLGDNPRGFLYICIRLPHLTAELPLFHAGYHSSAARFIMPQPLKLMQ